MRNASLQVARDIDYAEDFDCEVVATNEEDIKPQE